MFQDQIGLEKLTNWVDVDPRYRRFVVCYRGPVREIGLKWTGGWIVRLKSSRRRKGELVSHVGQSILTAAFKAIEAFER